MTTVLSGTTQSDIPEELELIWEHGGFRLLHADGMFWWESGRYGASGRRVGWKEATVSQVTLLLGEVAEWLLQQKRAGQEAPHG